MRAASRRKFSTLPRLLSRLASFAMPLASLRLAFSALTCSPGSTPVSSVSSKSTDNAFVQISSTLTLKLQHAQLSAAIPGGVVVCIVGTIGNPAHRFAAVIKAERQEGFRKRVRNGQTTLQLIRDLFLTPTQKLYKIGFFVELNRPRANQTPAVADYQAHVYDSNPCPPRLLAQFPCCAAVES